MGFFVFVFWIGPTWVIEMGIYLKRMGPTKRDPIGEEEYSKCGKTESRTNSKIEYNRAMQACRFQALAIWG